MPVCTYSRSQPGQRRRKSSDFWSLQKRMTRSMPAPVPGALRSSYSAARSAFTGATFTSGPGSGLARRRPSRSPRPWKTA